MGNRHTVRSSRDLCSEWSSAIYNFRLPSIALPDINEYSLVPESVREFAEKLLEDLPTISAPSLEKHPLLGSALQAWSNIDILGFFSAVGDYSVWLVTAPIKLCAGASLWLLATVADFYIQVSNFLRLRLAFYGILNFIANVFFGVPFTGIDRYMGSPSLLWNLFFVFRYIIRWLVWPFMIIPRGLWAASNIADAAYDVLVKFAWPVFFMRLKNSHPSAVSDFFVLILVALFFIISIVSYCLVGGY